MAIRATGDTDNPMPKLYVDINLNGRQVTDVIGDDYIINDGGETTLLINGIMLHDGATGNTGLIAPNGMWDVMLRDDGAIPWIPARTRGPFLLGPQALLLIGTSRPTTIYRRYHDVTLPTVNGTTQIDHVFVSVFGVFVVETKNMGGWIFGSGQNREWTQVFPGGKNHKFQNPLHQNYGHVRAMEDALAGIGLPRRSVKSVVVFVGDAELKRERPQNVTMSFPMSSNENWMLPPLRGSGTCWN